jgi:hypothetical protein
MMSPPPASSADPTDTLWGSTRAAVPRELTPSDLRQKLEDEGYRRIRGLTPDREGGYKATAMRFGKEVTLVIDAEGNAKVKKQPAR